ncbi:hypothetical protein HMPREF0083_06091 [Aneurinibacillus aneurinilyticus ATCC 12856]|uniref:Uncharacterized protein n=1 Tax=Aneurinibacillus aneurinilyticus ATCC 12856 TaxID=649747 RepID=U1WP53_ANEAE|nr:hypothetical protein HMPREF0083_06091 [Aneurinibacillus aneurinilyticus ATCC 12856]
MPFILIKTTEESTELWESQPERKKRYRPVISNAYAYCTLMI